MNMADKKAKRIFMATLGEKLLEFRQAVSQLCLRYRDTAHHLGEVKSEDFLVLRTDFFALMHATFTNLHQLLSCVFHQYNYEESISTRESNFTPIQPELDMVARAKATRNKYADDIQKYLNYFSSTVMPSCYKNIKDADELSKILLRVCDDMDLLSLRGLYTNVMIIDCVEKARFQIEDEKKRMVRLARKIQYDYPGLDKKSGKRGRSDHVALEAHKLPSLQIEQVDAKNFDSRGSKSAQCGGARREVAKKRRTKDLHLEGGVGGKSESSIKRSV